MAAVLDAIVTAVDVKKILGIGWFGVRLVMPYAISMDCLPVFFSKEVYRNDPHIHNSLQRFGDHC